MVGYWKRMPTKDGDGLVSRPFGKFAQYYKDGSFKCPDGIYCGSDKKWNELVYTMTINDYAKNQTPKMIVPTTIQGDPSPSKKKSRVGISRKTIESKKSTEFKHDFKKYF